MEKIYSKFVKERKKEFQIETALWNSDGRRVITKRSLYEEGKKHVQHIYDTFRMYQDREILCGASFEDNIITFEYVQGNTFEEILLCAVNSGKKDNVLQTVQKYDEILNTVCLKEEEASVNQDKEFQVIFGEAEDGITGYRNAIFDLTFDNLICQGDSYKIIDYEWRFPFAVEKEFIKFRAVYAFLMKYSGNINGLYTKDEFYEIFGLKSSDFDRYMEYNIRFVEYIYGKEGYNHILEKYKKHTMNVCEDRVINTLRLYSEYDRGNKDVAYEDKIYEMLLKSIEEHRELYDDYRKFFEVTGKLKGEKQAGYLASREFYEEFTAYIQGSYDMMDYYRNETGEKQKIVEQFSDMLEQKLQENTALAEKYSRDYEILTGEIRKLEKKLEYIQSCKAYKAFLAKKVEERFE